MEIYVDGSGSGSYGFIADDTVRVFFKANITSNQAEYLTVIEALDWVKEKDVTILSDSQLIVNQLNHKFHIKDDKLRELALKVWNLIETKGLNVEFKWIPREENKAGKLIGSTVYHVRNNESNHIKHRF